MHRADQGLGRAASDDATGGHISYKISLLARRRPRWRLSQLLGLLAAAVLLVLGSAVMPAQAIPPSPALSGAPEDYAVRAPHSCLNGEPNRRGVWGLRNLLQRNYPGTTPGAIWAPCRTHSPTSDHHTGRAYDWMVVGHEADADEVVDWLLETVDGVPHARVRHMGIRYIIWDNRIWSTSNREWREYANCSSRPSADTACHRDHVHFSFGVQGADGKTSWWRSSPQPSRDNEQQPYRAEQVCGSGFRVIDRAKIGTAGTAYLLWKAATNENCVVTLKARDIGAPTPVTAYLEPDAAKRRTDSGSFRYYAGPIRAHAPSCVRWGGSIGDANYNSPREHCGS